MPKTKILIADDEQVITQTLGMILRRREFDTTECHSAEDAVELALAADFDFAVLDVAMLGRSGIWAAIEILKHAPDTRILLMSGNQGTSDLLDQAAGAGYRFEILAKPFSPLDLIAKLGGL